MKRRIRPKKIREIYRYDEMSNKVLKVDKRFMNTSQNPQRDAEISQPKSMSGRISAKDMGQGLCNNINKGLKENDVAVEKTGKSASLKKIQQHNTILNSSSDFRLHYYPKDLSNVETYEQILQWVTEVLGNDIPHDLIIGTADILIRQLKENEENEDGNIEERKEKIQHELGINIDSLKFNELVKLMKNITDYETHPDNSNKQAVAILADDEKSDEEEVTEMSNSANVLGGEINDNEDDDEEYDYNDVEVNSKKKKQEGISKH